VRPDWLADPGAPRDPADDAPRTVPVQPPAIVVEEDRPLATLARAVRGASGMVTTLPALRVM